MRISAAITKKNMETKMQPQAASKNPGDSVAISIISEIEGKAPESTKRTSLVRRTLTRVISNGDKRRLFHAAKVGLALVLVSLLYMLEVIHDRLGDNAMWAVMTVVVIFEFTAGATISKGINRGVGTILGGGLGFLMAFLAQGISGAGKAVVIGTSVFLFCSAATYIRMIPSIKKKYDYGALIFILTFSLVAVSGVRGDQIIKIASDRLLSIFIGFTICIFISLSILPVWSGDELHNSLASKFDSLACTIEEILEDYINKPLDEKLGAQKARKNRSCLSVLSSKTYEETMANFAKWEPWHGRFGFGYPWKKYLQIGELLRELAGSIIAVRTCLRLETQIASQCWEMGTKEQYETACSSLAYTMRELGDSIHSMKRYQQGESIISTIRLELCCPSPSSKLAAGVNQNSTVGGNFPSSLFLLQEIVDKVEELVKEVDGLAKTAGFTDL